MEAGEAKAQRGEGTCLRPHSWFISLHTSISTPSPALSRTFCCHPGLMGKGDCPWGEKESSSLPHCSKSGGRDTVECPRHVIPQETWGSTRWTCSFSLLIEILQAATVVPPSMDNWTSVNSMQHLKVTCKGHTEGDTAFSLWTLHHPPNLVAHSRFTCPQRSSPVT